MGIALAFTAAPAFAQSGGDGYRAVSPEIIGQNDGNGTNHDKTCGSSSNGNSTSSSDSANCATAHVSKAGSNELPFTGLDVGLVAVAGAALLGAGAGMRRLTRAPDAA